MIKIEATIDAFVAAFATVGFMPCGHDRAENGIEKIALYARSGKPTHAARQLASGEWTSKLGLEQDIQHTRPDDLAGAIYGSVILFLKRPRSSDPLP